MKVLILCSDGPHNKYLISKVCEEYNQVKIIIESGKDQLKYKFDNGKYRQYFELQYQRIRRKIMGSERYRKKFFLKLLSDFSYNKYDITFVDNINNPVAIQEAISFVPDICIVMGTSIIHDEMLAALQEIDVINIHGGFLPDYKGNHCFFFAVYNKEYDKIGSTIHFVNQGIDSGDIIERVIPNFTIDDSPESLYCKAEKKAVDRLIELLYDYKQQGKPLPRRKQKLLGRVYYTKDRKLYHDFIMFIRKLKGERYVK